MKIILASSSPRRKELIKMVGLPFEVVDNKFSEEIYEKNPAKLVTRAAYLKALSVIEDFSTGFIIGADTVVVLDNEIIGKPKNRNDAITILKKLSGTTHKVYTGVAIIDSSTGRAIIDYEISYVKMRKLTDREIEEVAEKHLDKAGAYAIQEKNDRFVEEVKGDYYNVVGLPVNKIKQLIRNYF